MSILIKEISSSDIDDLEHWQPRDLADIYFPLGLILGQEGHPGGDLFYVLVASPEAFRARSYLGSGTRMRHCKSG